MSETYSPAKIALVATGGTISALAEDPFEILDYGAAGTLSAAQLLERAPGIAQGATVVPVDFSAVPSFQMHAPQWRSMLALFHDLVAAHPDLTGIVMTHGTGSLEETAFLLSLAWDLPVALAITGAQRPASALGGDGWMNIAQAVQTVRQPWSPALGVVVVMHGEIHLAADVVKTSNLGLDTFQSPGLGPIGYVLGLSPALLRRPDPDRSLTGRFAGALRADLPRVDILFCHTGGDAVAIEAFIAARTQGIVVAGFAPGYATAVQAGVLEGWIRNGKGVVIHASRASGPTVQNIRNAGHRFIPSGRFPPAKARLLLQLCLQEGLDNAAIESLFRFH